MYTPTGIRLTTNREPSLSMRFHLVGIGGAGMSALARWLRHKGATVSGSDLTESPTLHALRQMGADAYAAHDAYPHRAARLAGSLRRYPPRQPRSD
jgi:UDP-N-acetylmuramate-alanine ligase